MMVRQHEPAALEEFGRRHVCYELLQAQLVHLRALDDFLATAPIHKDDVAAVHYLASWDRSESFLGKHRGWINKQLAHLSMAREQAPLWNPMTLTRDVLEGVDAFLCDLESSNGTVTPFEAAQSVIESFLEWFYVLQEEQLDEAEAYLARQVELDVDRFEFSWSYSDVTGS